MIKELEIKKEIARRIAVINSKFNQSPRYQVMLFQEIKADIGWILEPLTTLTDK